MGRERQEQERFFVLKSYTTFSDLVSKNTISIPESDLCLQDNQGIYQFKLNEPPSPKYKVYPGISSVQEDNVGIVLEKLDMRKSELLLSITNTHKILHEANTFFNRLSIYDELGENKIRRILLYSAPGLGKTSTITHYCHHAVQEDPGTVVMVWPTSSIESDAMSKFLRDIADYDKSCTRLILVVEDIGGNEREGSGNPRGADSAMLDLLDGVGNVFRLPTFLIATTNYPQNLLAALADRPGRFDQLIQLLPPSAEERVRLVSFIAKRPLLDSEKDAIRASSLDKLSIAHLKEIVIRSRLHDKSLVDTVKELLEHKRLFESGFESDKAMGFE